MQRLKLQAGQFIRLGLLSALVGAGFIASFETFLILAIGMAFLGTALGLCMPAISAGASLAVSADEQGAVAGMISSCPAIGFVIGPICAGFLYQINGSLAAIFSGCVFFIVLVCLVLTKKKATP